MAGFVLANGSMSSNQSGEGDIRRALIEADLVDCMVALPGQLFYSTQIPVCLWFLAKNKAADAKRGFRDRRKQTLFIDARKLGTFNGGPRSPRTYRRRPSRIVSIHLPRVAGRNRTRAKYEDVPGSVNPRPPPKSSRIGYISSHPAATSAQESRR